MVDRALIMRLLCVALVAAIVLPLGGLLFPFVSGELSRVQFQALEAVFSATVGFGLFSMLG